MMSVFEKITGLLNDLEITFELIYHLPTPTSADSAAVRGDELSQGAKAILYKIEEEFYLFVLPADQRLNTKKVKNYFKSLGKKAKKTRFASADELLTLTSLVPGSVPPFGIPVLDFVLYVDPSLLINEVIAFNAGSLTNSIKMQSQDYLIAANPIVFNFID